MGFKKFLKENYIRISKFSLPIVSMGIGREREISENFISHNRAKKEGLLWKNVDPNYDQNSRWGDKELSTHMRRNRRIFKTSDKMKEHEKEQEPLSDDEKRAIEKYTDTSKGINQKLYHIHNGGGGMNSDDPDMKHVSNLDNIMGKRKSLGGIVYTGLGTKFHRNIGNMLKRGITHNPSYTSVSNDIEVAKGFSQRDNEGNHHVLEIHLPKDHPGVFVPPYSFWGESEHETVLPRGMSFKIHPKPKLYNKQGIIYHVWKAHPVNKEEAEVEHNKNLNKMLDNYDAVGLQDYHDNEASEDDKKILKPLTERDHQKQLEYFGDKRNHALLAGNSSLRPDLQEYFEKSNIPGIMKHFARTTGNPDLHKKYLSKGLHNELMRNPQIGADIAKEVAEKGDPRHFHHMLVNMENPGWSTENDRKLDEVLPIMINRGDLSTHHKILNTDFQKENGDYHADHISHMIKLNNPNLTKKLLVSQKSHVKYISDDDRKSLLNIADPKDKHHVFSGASSNFNIDVAKNGSDEDKLAMLRKFEEDYGGAGIGDVTKHLSNSKNVSILKKLANNDWMIDKETKNKLAPIHDYQIEKYINDPETHKLLIHNPNIEKQHLMRMTNSNPSIVNDIIERHHADHLPIPHYHAVHVINHIAKNHAKHIKGKNIDKFHDMILNADTYTLTHDALDHVINHSKDSLKRGHALEKKNKLIDIESNQI